MGPDNRMNRLLHDVTPFVESLGRIAASTTEEQVVREIVELFRQLGPATAVLYAPVKDGQMLQVWSSAEGGAAGDKSGLALRPIEGAYEWDAGGDLLALRFSHRGTTLGFLQVAGAAACLSGEEAHLFAPVLAAVCGLAIGNARIYGELGRTAGELQNLAQPDFAALGHGAGYLTTHDSDTGLYSRMFFDEELARLEHSRRFPISIIVVDVRALTRGESSDTVMQEISGALDVAFRGDDVLARIGADRFGIILPDTNPQLAGEIRERIRRMLAEHATIGEQAERVAFGSATAEKGEWLIDALHRAEDGLIENR